MISIGGYCLVMEQATIRCVVFQECQIYKHSKQYCMLYLAAKNLILSTSAIKFILGLYSIYGNF